MTSARRSRAKVPTARVTHRLLSNCSIFLCSNAGSAFASLSLLPFTLASPRQKFWRNASVNGKSDKDANADPAVLHKKMLQLLSSLWMTRAVGTFARLGLADVMEDGIEDHAAIAAARG